MLFCFHIPPTKFSIFNVIVSYLSNIKKVKNQRKLPKHYKKQNNFESLSWYSEIGYIIQNWKLLYSTESKYLRARKGNLTMQSLFNLNVEMEMNFLLESVTLIEKLFLAWRKWKVLLLFIPLNWMTQYIHFSW